MLLLRPRLSRSTAVQMPIRKRESMPLSGFLAGLPSCPLLFGVTRCWAELPANHRRRVTKSAVPARRLRAVARAAGISQGFPLPDQWTPRRNRVLPAKRRQMRKQFVWDLLGRAQGGDGAVEIAGVPKDDGRDQQVQPARVLLVLVTTTQRADFPH